MDCDPRGTLIAALRDDDRIVAARAAQLLGELKLPEATGVLVEYVTTSRHYCKTTGFAALAAIGDRGACEAIRPLVDAPNVEDDWYWIGCRSVRAAAAVALLALGDDAGAAYLASLADAGEEVFFAWFAPAILALPDELKATAALKARIAVDACCAEGIRKVRQTDPGVLVWVVRVLGILANDAAQDRLGALLSHRSRYIRGQAALSLLAAGATYDSVAAVDVLVNEDPTDFVRIKAALALSLADRPRVGAIIAALDGAGDPFDRAVAIEALGLLGAGDCSASIADQLTHDDAYVRRCAIEALDRLAGPRAAEMVQPSCKDPDPLVRLQAAKVLAQGGAA